MFKKAFATANIASNIVDVFCIPDIWGLIVPCMKPIDRLWKEEWTQLQFIFESVIPSIEFPFGVRTTYRAYSSDEVIEVWDPTTISFNEASSRIPLELPFIPVKVILVMYCFH